MTADVDRGDVVATERFSIADDETAFSLNARCYEAALASFPVVAAALAARELPTAPQPSGEHRMFKRHDRPARLIDPGLPARVAERNVRALDVGRRIANTVGAVRWVLGNESFVVDHAERQDSSRDANPGALVALSADGARIATTEGDLVVKALSTPEGAAVDVVEVMRRRVLTRRAPEAQENDGRNDPRPIET